MKIWASIVKWLLVVIAIVVIVVVFRSCRHEKTTLKEVKENITQDSTRYWRDKYKTEHAVNNDIVINSDAAKILFKSKIDSLKDRLHLKEKQIKDILESIITVSGDVSARIDTIPIHDTINGLNFAYTFNYADSLISVTGAIDSMVHFHYDINDIPLHYTGYWKRKWFLGKKHFFVDAYSDYPNVHIKKVMKISIEKK